MDFLQVMRRFFAIRGYPKSIVSDNGTQLVEAVTELRKAIKGLDAKKLREFSAERGIEWRFITPGAPHHNGCAEALVKSVKIASNSFRTPYLSPGSRESSQPAPNRKSPK